MFKTQSCRTVYYPAGPCLVEERRVRMQRREKPDQRAALRHQKKGATLREGIMASDAFHYMRNLQ